jgi:tetratricopeptide (TPR) repeat protein
MSVLAAGILLAILVAFSGAAAAGEAEWKARYDAAQEALLQTDMDRAKALFATLGRELEAALRDELARGKDRAETATVEVWLASVYLHQGRYPDAARLLQAAYDTRVKKFGETSEPVAEVIDRLARLGNDDEEAIVMLRRALEIREKVHGPDHRALAANLHDIGINRLTVHRYGEAEAAYKRAIAIVEKLAGRDSVDVVEPLNDLAWLYLAADREKDAIPIYQRALAIVEESAADDDRLADALEHLAYAYRNAERPAEAEPLYLRALPIREKLHGPKHVLTLSAAGHLKDIYDAQGRKKEAEEMARRLAPDER